MRLAGFVSWAAFSLVVSYLFFVADAGFRRLGEQYPGQRSGGLLLLLVLPLLIYLANRVAAAHSLRRHVTRSGWASADPGGREWPWAAMTAGGTVQIGQTWEFETDGLPVTAGEIRWRGGALHGAVSRPEGKGIFVVLRLPRAAPSMALHMPYEFVGDAPVLTRPALREAYLGQRIPPWTVRDRELFTVTGERRPIRPAMVQDAVRRTLLVAGLLELVPGGLVPDGLVAGESGAGDGGG
ncbi:hypothetical protein [Actinoplanes derwentensis]|uniref:Uncharacterized protein n=1 Tax=Actinoplanes derwentensis TaxID=113562 RepID=A0A1H1Z7H9_9ACTN|nr:hypothetical protein [Actinoplanes derwentensis]GID81478.1 hypothetical protein Ade03nite_04020 [Actinoplanes derwentensis]SDT29741.1 hypothetical protein SAMN04489716_3185 [Actinoplanes derwentensis]